MTFYFFHYIHKNMNMHKNPQFTYRSIKLKDRKLKCCFEHTEEFSDCWRELSGWILRVRGKGMCLRRCLGTLDRVWARFGRLILFVIEFRLDWASPGVRFNWHFISGLAELEFTSRLRPGVVRMLRAVR